LEVGNKGEKMKANRLPPYLALAVLLMALLVSPAAAEGNVIYITGGSEVPPDPDVCFAAGGTFDPGDGACVLEYGAFSISPSGTHLSASRISYWRDESSDARLTGYNTVHANLYLDLRTGAAHMWGTWYLVPDGDWEPGTGWQGTWNAQALPNGKFFMVGYGSGTGSFEGMQVVLKREVTMLIGVK
jgi:hypothetical protein